MFDLILPSLVVVGLSVVGYLVIVRQRENTKVVHASRFAHWRHNRLDAFVELRGKLCSDKHPEDEHLLDRLAEVNQQFDTDEFWEEISASKREALEDSFERIFWVLMRKFTDRFGMLVRIGRMDTSTEYLDLSEEEEELMDMIRDHISFLECVILALSGDSTDEDLSTVLQAERHMRDCARMLLNKYPMQSKALIS
jgi:hypothetical protein